MSSSLSKAQPQGTILFQGYIHVNTVPDIPLIIGVYERCSLINLILPKNDLENPTADNIYPISPYGVNFKSSTLFNALNYSSDVPAITSNFNLMKTPNNGSYQLFHGEFQINIKKYVILFAR